jgi:hypothetical protein
MKNVKVSTLKAAFDRILEKLEFEEVDLIQMESNFYNIVPADKWDITLPETKIEIGSLWDDVDEIEKLVLDKDRICTYVDFDRVASILRAISQVRNPPGDP